MPATNSTISLSAMRYALLAILAVAVGYAMWRAAVREYRRR